MPLTRKLLLMFVIGVLIPTFVFLSFFFQYTISHYHDRTVEDNASMLSMTAQNIEANMLLVENVIESLAYDKQLITLLSSSTLSPYDRVVLQLVDVAEAIATAQMFISSLDGDIIVFSNNTDVLPSYWRYLHIEMAEAMPDYQRYIASGQTGCWTGISAMRPEKTTLQRSDQKYLLTYYREILSGLTRSGVLKCGVSPTQLFFVVDRWEGDGKLSVWLDETPVYGSYPHVNLYEHIDREQRVQRYLDQLVINIPFGCSGFHLSLCIDSTSITQQAMRTSMPQIMFAACMVLLFISIVSVLLSNVSKRLRQGAALAQQAKVNDMDIILPDMGKDEVGQLIEAFNALLGRLQAVARDRIAQEENEKMALLLALQYQINPHFLFNTLSWVQVSIEMDEDRAQLYDVIGYLGKLLRYNLSGESTASLREEVDNTMNYIHLMNLRKHDLITLSTDVAELPDEMRLLRFVFQPLVENAIQHGMYPGRQLHISLRGYLAGGLACFFVENDGRPISAEKLALLRTDIDQARSGKGVGLANIAARLRLLYGDDTRFDVYSSVDVTRISFSFAIDTPLKIVDTIAKEDIV